ncbi:S-layer homology domain-containing protein [Marinigracilibium pacificum]|uniref:SLH domain-containing protein n=1 Tax=Marinigracilibium pacificum TaxID=2729599 RepID=A0A848J0A1_9BACT|nr:S-layer homology domain-containing protein [Marinigracilibium pacificum]NMM49977.1 hypothetical protein [Marinigracilibium pacificum]
MLKNKLGYLIALLLLVLLNSCDKEEVSPTEHPSKISTSIRSVSPKSHDRDILETGTPPGVNTNSNARISGTNKLGMWLWYLEGTGYSSHTVLANDLAKMGVSRIYVKVADGTNIWKENKDKSVVNAYKNAGLEVWAWAYNYPGNEYAQADAVYYAARAGYDGFVTDIEVEFDGKSTELHNLFKEFRKAITQAGNDGYIGDFKLYCTSWGNPKDHGMRVDIIDQYVDAHMPQTYLEVWGNTYMSNARYWVDYGTNEYKALGCKKPVHHILSAEYNTITSGQLNEAIQASGSETSIWRIPGGGTSLDIWKTLENVNWSANFGNQNIPFRDIRGHWAEKEISALINKGFLSGYSDGTFRPDQSLTRAEFAAMISSTINPAINPDFQNRSFTDISSHWAKSHILKVARAGYLSGYPDGTFRPDQRISKYQMLIALASHNGLTNANESVLNYFTDYTKIPTWARKAVARAAKSKLIANYPTLTTLDPLRNASRAETVMAIYQILTLEGKVSQIVNNNRVTDLNSTGYIKGVPYFYQLNNDYNPYGSCQNTSVAMVINYYGGNTSPDEISDNYGGTDKGQTVPGLESIFNSEASYFGLNVRVSGTTKGSLTRLNQLLKEGKPVIAHGYTTSYGHVMVFLGFDGTYYTVHDPYGKWDQKAYSSGYYNSSTSGKTVKYHKDAIREAFSPDGLLWMHEIYFK